METSSFDDLVASFGQLYHMQDEDNDRRAAELYRAMFRHDRDIHKLDFHYADHILGYVSLGLEKAIEDYKNYLQYLKAIVPSEYPSHLEMLNEEMSHLEEEDCDE